MLVQLHHQFKDDSTQMCTQRDINTDAEMTAFFKEIEESHPLPKKAIWMACTQDSKHFVITNKSLT